MIPANLGERRRPNGFRPADGGHRILPDPPSHDAAGGPDVPTLPIYLDNHATTRTDPRVLDAMLPYFTMYGNAASVSHRFGWDAGAAVDAARERVAAAIGAEAREIVFTSGATEANNLALKGALPALKRKGHHVVTAATEHKAVLDPLKRLAREGLCELTVLPPDSCGRITADSVAEALTDRTVLVSVMAANNEVGTLNPIGAIGRLCHERGILFHTDATQAVGKIALDVRDDAIDLLSLSAHKIYGPKGIGALYVRRRDPQVRLTPLVDGGGHERGLRSGTVAVPLVVGLGEAAELATRERPEEAARLLALRERLHEGIAERVEAIQLNGHPTLRLPGNLNLSFAYVDGEALMMAMRDVAVSSGAACTSAEPEPSHVLLAMGLDEEMARASLRFGLGRFTTAEEIDFAIGAVTEAVGRLRPLSAAWSVPGGPGL
jgi:cysteine desulfurase